MDAAAIVVGVDAYTGVPGLTGSVQDALDATAWLLEIGVPAERIRLHLAATGQIQAPAGVAIADATRDEIWGSVYDLFQTKAKGEQLFVFLSGHGYYLASSGPIFLCSDYSKKYRNKNLDIRAFVEFFQGLGFKSTLFVVDACQNYDVDPSFRSAIQANGPEQQNVQADPQNGLLLICAAEQEQYAPIVDGRGLLTRTLLAALRAASTTLKRAAGDAIAFDWTTGQAQLDLIPLFQYSVQPDVAAAAQVAQQRQNPTMTYAGRLTREWRFIVRDMPELKSVPLSVTAKDIAGLDFITLAASPPVRGLDLPLAGVTPMPFKGFAPADRRLDANCGAIATWQAVPENRSQPKSSTAVAMDFVLSPVPQPGGSPVFDAPIVDFNIKMINAAGAPYGDVQRPDYDTAFAGIGGFGFDTVPHGMPFSIDKVPYGTPMVVPHGTPFGFDKVPHGSPIIVPHETGPDVLRNGASHTAVADLAAALQRNLTASVAERVPGASFVLIPPDEEWGLATLPNVQFVLPHGEARAVAGWLEQEPLIRLERQGRAGPDAVVRTWSADDLAAQPWQKVEPGSYRLVVGAPWGEAVQTFTIRGIQNRIDVPVSAAEEPLRNRLTVLEFHELETGRPKFFVPGAGPTHLDAERLGLSYIADWEGGTLLASSVDGLRVEPFSSLPWSEWDQLLVAGRMEGINLPCAISRSRPTTANPAELDLMRLALAYVAWAQNDMGTLQTLLAAIGEGLQGCTDRMLLSFILQGAKSDATLKPPLLRWGVGLAQLVAPNTEIPGVISPRSAWALYEVGKSSAEHVQYAVA